MRKLVLQMHMTVDGFVAGPEGQMDWMLPGIEPEQLLILRKLTENMDTILMGRKMAAGFTNHWENVADYQPANPEYPYAKIFVETPKIVFSRTVSSIPGRNVRVEKGELVEAICNLKKMEGRDIIVYGGAGFVSSLVNHRLIDELYLFVNPVSLGKGLSIFSGKKVLNLVLSTACSNGVVINQYRLTEI